VYKTKILLFLLLFISSSLSFALPRHNPVPGGLALLAIPEQSASTAQSTPRAYYKKNRLAIISENNQHYALVGIPLKTKSGEQHISVQWDNGKKLSLPFTVKDKTYKAQYLTIKNKRKVNPSKEDLDRIEKERKRKNRAKTRWTDQSVNNDFIIPVDGRVSSIFGLRRFFNQQPRRPHAGLDIAAPEGTPIKAVESGTVIEAGDFFFSGNMVYIDHGQGLISLYAHMNSIGVKIGDRIKRGQQIGTVGQTGRVTGPHLHLAVFANQTMIDPVFLLPDLHLTENTEY